MHTQNLVKFYQFVLKKLSGVALRPKSTAMVMALLSVHLTSFFFLGKLEQAVNQYFVHTDNNPT